MNQRGEQTLQLIGRWFAPILLVLLIPMLGTGYVVDHNARMRDYKSKVAACKRGNLIRQRVNLIADRMSMNLPPLLVLDCTTAYERPTWFWQ